jgi:hypothetical protein
MITRRPRSEQEMQSRPSSEQAHQLWTQLSPDLRRQLAQRWAKMVQKMRQQNTRGEEVHDVWG